MRLLTIDTSTRIGSVAAIDGASVLCSLQSTEQTAHAERLLALVQAVLGQAGWSLADLELIASGMGPGSFTGVRVGMATAKGLASATGLPLLGVVSLEAMAEAARRLQGARPVLALLDAKKGEVFAAAYQPDGSRLAEPVHLPRARVTDWIGTLSAERSELVACGEVASELELPGIHVVRDPASDLPSPPSIGVLAQQQWAEAPHSRLHDLEPLYVRPPDIQPPRSRQ